MFSFAVVEFVLCISPSLRSLVLKTLQSCCDLCATATIKYEGPVYPQMLLFICSDMVFVWLGASLSVYVLENAPENSYVSH